MVTHFKFHSDSPPGCPPTLMQTQRKWVVSEDQYAPISTVQ